MTHLCVGPVAAVSGGTHSQDHDDKFGANDRLSAFSDLSVFTDDWNKGNKLSGRYSRFPFHFQWTLLLKWDLVT